MGLLLVIVAVLVLGLLVKKFSRKTTAMAISPLYFIKPTIHEEVRAFINLHKPRVLEIRGLDAVLITHPDSIEEVVKGDAYEFAKGKMVKDSPLHMAMNDSLTFSSGDTWKMQRQTFNTTFHFDHIQSMLHIFKKKAKNLANSWSDKDKVEVNPYFQELTLEILVESIFGQSYDVLKQREPNLMQLYADFIVGITNAMYLIFPSLTRLPTPYMTHLKGLVNRINKVSTQMILERQEQINNGAPSADLLSKAMADGKLDTERILANAWAFFTAGHETTSQMLSWALYYMAKYPEHQQTIYDEIVREIGPTGDITADNIKKLVFLDMFIKELLRIRVPLPMLLERRTTKPVTIAGIDIPADFSVFVCVDAVHHSEGYWEEPEIFNPYRFSAENSAGRNAYCYLPFHTGRRTCIGMNFATLEKKVVLTTLLQTYSIHYIQSATKRAYSFLNSPESVYVSLTKRS